MKNLGETNACGRVAEFAVRAGFLCLALISGTAEAVTSAAYFPLTPHATWLYSNSKPPNTADVGLPGTTLINGNVCTVLRDFATGREAYYLSDANGIKACGNFDPSVPAAGFGNVPASLTFVPPQVLATADSTLGIPVGSSGFVTLNYQGIGTVTLNYTATSTPLRFESVQTPAGTFNNALVLQTVTRTFGTISGPGGTVSVEINETEMDWLVSGVGLVQSSTSTVTNGGPPDLTNLILKSSNLIYTNAISFQPVSGAALNTAVTSEAITVSGATVPFGISITGGQYSIGGGAFTSAPGSVGNGQTVSVRLISAATTNTQSAATLTIGGVSATFSVTTLPPFSFTPQSGVSTNAAVASETSTVTGLNAPSPISITGGSYSVNGAPYTAATGTVNNGDVVSVQVSSSSSERTQTCATLTIGGVSGQFCATTLATPLQNLMQILNILRSD